MGTCGFFGGGQIFGVVTSGALGLTEAVVLGEIAVLLGVARHGHTDRGST